MPERDPAVAPPFDQGVFLLHYNRGREAFQEGRYAEARRELENAQRLRPDDSDVLNLLGLVYFKTNAFPEAEVIYRRLVTENPNVFILHSNLGLILFKQGRLDDSEQFLLRSVELRPNYAKSHLYLGLLYRQRKKLGMALEHLRFAGADKLVREVEAELRPQSARQVTPPAPSVPPAAPPAPKQAAAEPNPQNVITQKVPAMRYTPPSSPEVAAENRTQPGAIPMADGTMALHPPSFTIPGGARPAPPAPPSSPVAPATARVPASTSAAQMPSVEPREGAAHTAARKLQEAVDDVQHADDKRIDLAHKIEGASRTFALHENGFLEINFRRSVHVKRGTVSSYSGNLKFVAETGLLGTTAQTLVRATGQGKIFVYEKGRKTFLLDLNEEFIYVEGSNLLALEDTLTYRVEPIYDASYQRKIDTVKIFGKGSLAISTDIEPLTLRVTREYPLSISSNALVAWTGNIIPTVMEDQTLENVMIESGVAGGFKIRFEGDGVVVSEQ
jgi:uncharacterized protein (AIM24 family)